MLTIGIILIIVSILLVIYSVHSLRNVHQLNQDIDKQNQELQQEYDKLIKNLDVIKKEFFNENQNYRDIKQEVLVANKELTETKRHLNDIQNNILKTTETQKELSQKAFENYCEVLEKQYDEQEKEYDMYKDALETSYSNRQLELMRELDEVQKELDSIKATRAAAIQAQTREKEIEENKDNFRLNISEVAMKDIRLLKSIQKDISNSIVIDKIIWSNYYQPMAKVKFPKIIGKDTACGIYKITSLTTGLAYIGQSTDCCDRWKQHCKNALGVGTVTSTNKLYNAMKEEGLYNFTFEILEECQSSLLDEKEKYYISLYDTYNFGLNGNRGNNG